MGGALSDSSANGSFKNDIPAQHAHNSLFPFPRVGSFHSPSIETGLIVGPVTTTTYHVTWLLSGHKACTTAAATTATYTYTDNKVTPKSLDKPTVSLFTCHLKWESFTTVINLQYLDIRMKKSSFIN